MAKKWSQSLVKEIRKKEEERQGTMPFLYLPKEGESRIKIEVLDETFTQFFEGEKGFDGREISWPQAQLQVIDYADNRRKAFKPNTALASLIWLRTEEEGKDPLDMEGLVFEIEKNGYDQKVTLIKTARIRDGEKHKEDEIADEEKTRKIVKQFINDNPDKGIKEVSLWVMELLKEEDLKGDKKLISKIIAEEME